MIPSLKLISISVFISPFPFSFVRFSSTSGSFFSFLLFFLNLGWLFERSRLRADFVLFGILHDRRRVDWEVARLLVELVAIAQVDLLDLTVVEEGERARPEEGANNDDGVRFLSLDRIRIVVLSLIAANANAPTWSFEFHAS